MHVEHVDHLNLSVRSFEDTASWYGRIFGFEVVESGLWRGRPWGVLKSGEALLCVYEDPERSFKDGNELTSARIHGMNHFALRIEDKAEWTRTVDREGVEVKYGGPVSWPFSTSWYVKDPTGYEVEVVFWNDRRSRFNGSQPAKL